MTDGVDRVSTILLRIALTLLGFTPVVVSIMLAFTNRLTAQALMILVVAELTTLLFALGLVVLHAIATDQIDIRKLVCESNGNASIARFQLLIFVFTIAMSFVYLLLCNNGKFPDIPWQVLALLGISATTYGGGKLLQNQSDARRPGAGAAPPGGTQ
jgi:hypothetical protein